MTTLWYVVQRSCRRRRRSTRWSTTSWTRHSPNSLASKRRRRGQRQSGCVVRHCHPFCCSTLQLLRCSCCHRRISSLTHTTPFTTKTVVGPSQPQQHLAFVYILQRRILMLYFIITLWRMKKNVYNILLIYFSHAVEPTSVLFYYYFMEIGKNCL